MLWKFCGSGQLHFGLWIKKLKLISDPGDADIEIREFIFVRNTWNLLSWPAAQYQHLDGWRSNVNFSTSQPDRQHKIERVFERIGKNVTTALDLWEIININFYNWLRHFVWISKRALEDWINTSGRFINLLTCFIPLFIFRLLNL